MVVALMNGYNCSYGLGAQRQAERYAPEKIVFGKYLIFLRAGVVYFMLKTPYSVTFVKASRQKCKRLHRKAKSRKTCLETKNAHSCPNTAGSLYAKQIIAAGGKVREPVLRRGHSILCTKIITYIFPNNIPIAVKL